LKKFSSKAQIIFNLETTSTINDLDVSNNSINNISPEINNDNNPATFEEK